MTCLTSTMCSHVLRSCPTHARPLTMPGRTQRCSLLPVRQPWHGGEQRGAGGQVHPEPPSRPLASQGLTARRPRANARASRGQGGGRARRRKRLWLSLAVLRSIARLYSSRVGRYAVSSFDAMARRMPVSRAPPRRASSVAPRAWPLVDAACGTRLDGEASASIATPTPSPALPGRLRTRGAPFHSAWGALASCARRRCCHSQDAHAHDSTTSLPAPLRRTALSTSTHWGSRCWQQAAPVQGRRSAGQLQQGAKAGVADPRGWREPRTSPWLRVAGTGPPRPAPAAAPPLTHAAPARARAARRQSRHARRRSATRPQAPAGWQRCCLRSSAAPRGAAPGSACQAAAAAVRPACSAAARALQALPAAAVRRPQSCHVRTGTWPAFRPLAPQLINLSKSATCSVSLPAAPEGSTPVQPSPSSFRPPFVLCLCSKISSPGLLTCFRLRPRNLEMNLAEVREVCKASHSVIAQVTCGERVC